MSKNIFVVLGMPRSGTSVLTKGLNALGIDLGTEITRKNDRSNPKGCFEDRDIVYKINRTVSLLLDHEWMSSNLEQQLHTNALRALRNEASQLVLKRMEQVDYWGFKDPRTSHLLPFWQEVFKESKLNDHYLLALRNPLSAALSFNKLSKIPLEEGLLIWLAHTIPAIEKTNHKKRIIVSYNRMMEDAERELLRMRSQLEISLPLNNATIKSYQNEFLEKKYQHFEHTIEDLKKHPSCTLFPILIPVFSLLEQVANDTLSLESQEFKSSWAIILKEFESNVSLYNYINKIQQEKKLLERNIKTIQKSLPYKLIFLLRIFDDFLREKRQKKRLEKRLKHLSA